jgi:hypothetical protein
MRAQGAGTRRSGEHDMCRLRVPGPPRGVGPVQRAVAHRYAHFLDRDAIVRGRPQERNGRAGTLSWSTAFPPLDLSMLDFITCSFFADFFALVDESVKSEPSA